MTDRTVKSRPAPWLLALLLSACATTPRVETTSHESADLADVAADARALAADLGPQEVLVVFDIDNTLLAMDQGLGADQWYEWQKELAAAEPCHEHIAGQRLAVQGALFHASAMRPTQPDAPDLVRQLQANGMTVMALTSRGVEFRLQTFRELRRNGYSFAHSGIGPPGGLGDEFTPPSGTRPARYEDGVFLTTGQHKGDMLKDLLDLTGTALPGVIVMADDKQANLDAMRETFTALGVPVRAWRYTREDAKVAAFDEEAAHELWTHLEPHLRAIQSLLGPDNYNLMSSRNSRSECPGPISPRVNSGSSPD